MKACKLDPRIPVLNKENAMLRRILREAIKHQVSNLGTGNEFYTCYTYPSGKAPAWIIRALKALDLPLGRLLVAR